MRPIVGREVELYPKGKVGNWSSKRGSDTIKLTF